MQTPRILPALATIALLFLPAITPAMIMVYDGNKPFEGPGLPDGALAVANLPERLGYMEGPPFGGGQYYFRYRCDRTTQFNEALQLFGAIRMPRIARELSCFMDGRSARLADNKQLVLVVHDGPYRSPDFTSNAKERVDWMFTIYRPSSFYTLNSNPLFTFPFDSPDYRRQVPPPQIDVFVTPDGPIRWRDVKVPDTVRVIDMRAESAPMDVKNGGVVRGSVYDMGSFLPVPAARIELCEQTTASARRITASSDKRGDYTVTGIPVGRYAVNVYADGYTARNAAAFDNLSGHAWLDFDTLLSRNASLKGMVEDCDGKPIPGAILTAVECTGIDGLGYQSVSQSTATTNAAGHFEMSGLPDGYTGLRCQVGGLLQKTPISEIYRVSANPWEEKSRARVVMAPSGTLRGTVVDNHGTSATRVFSMRLEPRADSRSGVYASGSQAGGTFEFSNVPAGEYILTARPDMSGRNDATESTPVVVVAHSTRDVELVSEHACEPNTRH